MDTRRSLYARVTCHLNTKRGAINPKDCEQTAKKCYAQYLFPVQVNSEKSYPFPIEDEDETPQNMTWRILCMSERMNFASLCVTFSRLYSWIWKTGVDIESYYGPGIIDEILDYFLEYLGFEQRLTVYRPMFITDDETGEEVYTEYPYDMDGLYECDDTDGEVQ